MKQIVFIFLLFLLFINCTEKPEKAFLAIDQFYALRSNSQYETMYQMFDKIYQQRFTSIQFQLLEALYKEKIGTLEKFNITRWSSRKNFSCGSGSGKMIVVTVDCSYSKFTTIETFTLIRLVNRWRIFDYNLRPLSNKQMNN